MLHEIGRLAGNNKHARVCRITPMVEALDAGEWWRSTGDWYFKGCGYKSLASAAPRRRVVEHVLRIEKVEIGNGRSADAHLGTHDRLPGLR